ncbi:MAG TPA: BON domain-containing protein [Pirellulaceae bacterium]|nr:hypothetical protein [Planctomycetales bacterium]MCB9939280.1 hypothetical protein [Planctomycetaceae bacterium]HRX77538.1 BON domain-containing protein [Pirellulaceae bacterium]
MITKSFRSLQERRQIKQDDDLKTRLVNFLHSRRVPGREFVRLNVHSGTVIVRGLLQSTHAKWLCIECCRHVAGVIKLVDELVIDAPRPGAHQRARCHPASAGARAESAVLMNK